MKDILLGKHHDITGFASTDETRYILNALHYNAKEQLLEATNGRVLIRVPVLESEDYPPTSILETARDCIIPIAPFKKALGNIPNGGSLPILKHMRLGVTGREDTTRVNLTTNDLDTEQNIACKPINGTYPDCKQVVPAATPTLTITISAILLKIIADYAVKHAGTDLAPVNFEFTESCAPVKFSIATSAETTATGVIMPIRTS